MSTTDKKRKITSHMTIVGDVMAVKLVKNTEYMYPIV